MRQTIDGRGCVRGPATGYRRPWMGEPSTVVLGIALAQPKEKTMHRNAYSAKGLTNLEVSVPAALVEDGGRYSLSRAEMDYGDVNITLVPDDRSTHRFHHHDGIARILLPVRLAPELPEYGKSEADAERTQGGEVRVVVFSSAMAPLRKRRCAEPAMSVGDLGDLGDAVATVNRHLQLDQSLSAGVEDGQVVITQSRVFR